PFLSVFRNKEKESVHISDGKSRMGCGEVWINAYSALERFNSSLVIGFIVANVQSFAPQVIKVCLRINLKSLREMCLLRFAQLDPDLPGNGPGHLPLQRQDVVQVALVALRPKVPVCCWMNQLDCNPNLVVSSQHGPDHHSLDFQLLGNVRARLP